MLNDFYKQFKSGTDIRGVASEGVEGEPLNLTNEAVKNMAGGFALWLSEKTNKKASDLKISIGRDSRISGPALLQAVGGQLDIAVIGVGSAGTVTGVGEYLKAWAGNVKIAAVEPHECSVLSGGFAGKHNIPGLGAGFKPGNYNPYIVDQIIRVPSHEAQRAASQLLLCEGVPAGAASGAVAAAAVQLASQPENAGKRIVALLPTRQEL